MISKTYILQVLMVLVTSFVLGSWQLAQAQESVEEVIPSDQVVDEQIEERRQAIIDRYRQEIEGYRAAVREFRLARTQFGQLQTLASLEAAVQATRRVFLVRTIVLGTYLESVVLRVEIAEGLTPAERSLLLSDLREAQRDLTFHYQTIEEAHDREAMADLADDFEELAPTLINATYQALSYLVLVELRVTYEQARQFEENLQEYHQTLDDGALKRAERNRAYREVDRTLTRAGDGLERIGESLALDDDFHLRRYHRLVENLQPIFADLSRSVAFLEELLTDEENN